MYVYVRVIRLGVGASKFLLAIKERNDDEKRRGNTGETGWLWRLAVPGMGGRRAGGRSLEPPEVPTTSDDKTEEATAR